MGTERVSRKGIACTRLVLEQTRYVYGEARTRISRYGIRVEPFDRAAAEARIASLGGKVITGAGGSSLERSATRFQWLER